MNARELTGQVRSHIVESHEPPCHAHVRSPLTALRRAATAEGMDVVALSGFRDFDRQLAIWNAKYEGKRTLNDAWGKPIDVTGLTSSERVDAILLWSALPGASRHHWGTDFDVIDRNAIAPGYQVQLISQEFDSGGPFAALSVWLDSNAPRFGFFRPFQGVRSGVRAEPWHLSFAPLAENARRELTPSVLRAALEAAPMSGKESVLERLDELHHRFVSQIDMS